MTPNRSDRPSINDEHLIAAPDWGDPKPEVEDALEWLHSRTYNAFYNSDRIKALSEDELNALVRIRLDAHEHLTPDEHTELRAYEKEIRRVESGDGPDGVDSTGELDAAWIMTLAEALEDDEDLGGDS